MDYTHTHDKKIDKKWDKPGFWFWDWVAARHCQLRNTRLVKIGEYKCSKNVLKYRYHTSTTPVLNRWENNMELTDSRVPSTKGAKSTISLKPTSQASFILTCVGIPDFNTNEHVSWFGSIHEFREFSWFYQNLEFDKCFDQVFD